MPSNELESRLARIEFGTAASGHRGVVIVRPGDDVAALVAAAPCAPGYGHLVLPADDESADEWERQAVAYFERQPT
jgi:hypothetical protein